MLTPAHITEYCRIKSGVACNAEESVLFTEQVERRLQDLTTVERNVVLGLGNGYTQGEVARMNGICLRSAHRIAVRASCKLFSEYNKLLGRKENMGLPKPNGRPRLRLVVSND